MATPLSSCFLHSVVIYPRLRARGIFLCLEPVEIDKEPTDITEEFGCNVEEYETEPEAAAIGRFSDEINDVVWNPNRFHDFDHFYLGVGVSIHIEGPLLVY